MSTEPNHLQAEDSDIAMMRAYQQWHHEKIAPFDEAPCWMVFQAGFRFACSTPAASSPTEEPVYAENAQVETREAEIRARVEASVGAYVTSPADVRYLLDALARERIRADQAELLIEGLRLLVFLVENQSQVYDAFKAIARTLNEPPERAAPTEEQ